MRMCLKVILLLISFFASQAVFSACLINYSGNLCAGNPIQFFLSPQSGVQFEWDFNGEGASTQTTPSFVFSATGVKKIKITLKDQNGIVCQDSININIVPKPEPNFTITTPTTQCYAGNNFCFIDKSASDGACIAQVSYLFDDGELVVIKNPTGDYPFCKKIYDLEASYGFIIEVINCNGCITKIRPPDIISVTKKYSPSVALITKYLCDDDTAELVNFTPEPPGGIKKFYWKFSDGTIDSTNWGEFGLKKFIKTNLATDLTIKLVMYPNEFCPDSVTLTIPVIKTKIEIKAKDTICIKEQSIHFSLKPNTTIYMGSNMKWKIFDPITESIIEYNNKWEVTHPFVVPGPYEILFTTNSPCGVLEARDTVLVLGPTTDIEDFLRGIFIKENERYQCVSIDTVHFTNASLYYHNDKNMLDDDSVSLFSGKKLWHHFFANQKSKPAKFQKREDDHILRLWDFDDPYAETCTTNIAAGINVGKNCRYSRDEFPVHFYKPWEEVYRDSFYLPNKPMPYSYYDPVTSACGSRYVDTTEKELHRELFYNAIPKCNYVRLWQKDTVHPYACEMEDFALISIMPPSAKNLRIGGKNCIGIGQFDQGLNLYLENTKPGCSQNIMYINPDSISNPNKWLNMIEEIKTGELPGNQPHKVYKSNGPFSNIFSLQYSNSMYTDPTGKIVLGLIVGNGTGNNKCLDTAWYSDYIQFPIMDDNYELVHPRNEHICPGDSILFTIAPNNQTDVSVVESVVWTAQTHSTGNYKTQRFRYTIEEFYKRNVPKPGNAKVLEDWLIVNRLNNGVVYKTDTFLLAQIDSWHSQLVFYPLNKKIEQALLSFGFNPSLMSPTEIAALIWNGVGTIGNPLTGSKGCIDTTGYGSQLSYKVRPVPGYKTTFHFRDTSLLPIDTLIFRGDTLKNHYFIRPMTHGQYSVYLGVSSGPCNTYASSLKIVPVGFYLDFEDASEARDTVICENDLPMLKPQIRYFEKDPFNNPNLLDPINYWSLRVSEAGMKNREGITKFDWSKADDDINNTPTIFGSAPYGQIGYSDEVYFGGTDANRLYYKNTGRYVVRMAAQDSSGCRDTVYRNIYVLAARANFKLEVNDANCVTIVELFDSSYHEDIFKQIFGKDYSRSLYWLIDWGDGSPPTKYVYDRPYKIGHDYSAFGKFTIKLKFISEPIFPNPPNGDPPSPDNPLPLDYCLDSAQYILEIPGPEPEIKPLTSLTICEGDSVTFGNIATKITSSSRWIWNFGDGFFEASALKDTVKHQYTKAGIYYVFNEQFDSIPNSSKYCSAVFPDTANNRQKPIVVTVLPRPKLKITPKISRICPNQQVVLSSESNNRVDSVAWFVDGVMVDTRKNGYNFSLTLRDTGSHMVHTMLISDSVPFCISGDTAYISVESVWANFEIDSSGTPIFCFKNRSLNAINYNWGFYHDEDIVPEGKEFKISIGSSDSIVCNDYYHDTGDFWVCLEAINDLGCKDTICKLINTNFEIFLRPYNVFTPGKDGFNDSFDIETKNVDLYELVIFNRWGDKVFESKHPSYDWNGRVNNTGQDCPNGTYYWILKYSFLRSDKEGLISGSVTLLRER